MITTDTDKTWSATVLTPGDFLRTYAEMTDVDLDAIRDAPGMPRVALEDLLAGRSGITRELAVALAKALDTPVYFWENVQSNYEEHLRVIAEREDAASDLGLLEGYPYEAACERGWFVAHDDPRDRVRTLRAFFGVATLRDVELPAAGESQRNGASGADSPQGLAMWRRKRELEAEEALVAAGAAPHV